MPSIFYTQLQKKFKSKNYWKLIGKVMVYFLLANYMSKLTLRALRESFKP